MQLSRIALFFRGARFHYSRGCSWCISIRHTSQLPCAWSPAPLECWNSGSGALYNRGMSMCGPTGPSQEPVGNVSGRKVFCVKFQKELPGLDAPPWPGEIGQRLYENVSAEAWKLWEDRQKMILNEYRLMPWQKEAQELILKHMEDFFFGEGAALPPGYIPQQTK